MDEVNELKDICSTVNKQRKAGTVDVNVTTKPLHDFFFKTEPQNEFAWFQSITNWVFKFIDDTDLKNGISVGGKRNKNKRK